MYDEVDSQKRRSSGVVRRSPGVAPEGARGSRGAGIHRRRSPFGVKFGILGFLFLGLGSRPKVFLALAVSLVLGFV